MEFTGERYVPGVDGLEDLYAEHMSRYLLAANFVGGGAALDLGCGCGYGAAYLAQHGAGRVVGVDISPEAVSFAAARYRMPNLAFAVMDVRHLALASRFGVITCFEVIEHIGEATEVLGEAARLLADDGVFLVSTPNKATYAAGGPDGSNPFHVKEYTRSEFEDLLRQAFPRTRLLEQAWTEGIVIGGERRGGPSAHAVVPLPPGGGGAAPPPADAAYFVAACGRTSALDAMVDAMPALLVTTASLRYGMLKRQMQKLETELDQRAAWARRLGEEVAERDKTIQELRAGRAALEKAYDERGRWAQGLARELEQERAALRRVKAEPEDLEEAEPVVEGRAEARTEGA